MWNTQWETLCGFTLIICNIHSNSQCKVIHIPHVIGVLYCFGLEHSRTLLIFGFAKPCKMISFPPLVSLFQYTKSQGTFSLFIHSLNHWFHLLVHLLTNSFTVRQSYQFGSPDPPERYICSLTYAPHSTYIWQVVNDTALHFLCCFRSTIRIYALMDPQWNSCHNMILCTLL